MSIVNSCCTVETTCNTSNATKPTESFALDQGCFVAWTASNCLLRLVTLQVLLRWGLQKGCAVIPKSLNKDHIAEASPSKLLCWTLSFDQMHALDQLEDGHKYCWDPAGVL